MFNTMLKNRMEELNKTQGDLAHRLGIPPHNLKTKMEHDGFTAKEMRIIAAALDCDLKLELIPRQ